MQMTTIITTMTRACSTIMTINTETVPWKAAAGYLPEAPATIARQVKYNYL